MNKIINFQRVTSFILIFSILIGIIGPYHVSADVVNTSESIYEVENSNGKVVLTLKMKNGDITLVAKSSAATTSIRWETIGIRISRGKINTSASTKGYNDGYGPVSDANGLAEKVLWVSSAADKSDVTIGDTVTTTIKFDAQQVEDALGANFDNIIENTPIYLHGVFDTYQLINGKKVLRSGPIYNWEDIMNAESWGSDTLNDFKKYYNMELNFKPAPQPNTIHYKSDDDVTLSAYQSLDSVLPGKPVSWTSAKAPATITGSSGTVYSLYKYVVKKKSDGSTVPGGTHQIGDSDGCTLSNIQNASTTVYLGGMSVFLYYKKSVSADIVINAVDSNDTKMQELYSGKVSPSENFYQSVASIVSYGGYNYKKTINYYYTYTNTLGVISTKIKKTTSTATDPIEFTIPSDVGVNTTVTVNVYYDKTVPGSIPITIFAVDKDTDKTIKTIATDTATAGSKYTYASAIASSLANGSFTYTYSGSWDWSYVQTSTSSIIKKTLTGTTITFTAPSANNITGGITVKVYYIKDGGSVTPIPTPPPSVPPVTVPVASAPLSMPLDSPNPYAVINGDRYTSPFFTSELGISTTESQYVYVKTKDYLLGYTLVNRTGKIAYTVPVTMKYTLSYYSSTPDAYGGKKQVTDTVNVTQNIKVERAYSYWEIANLEYYYVKSANIYNYSLPNAEVLLTANGAYLNLPSLITSHSTSLTDHVIAPPQVYAGITLTKTLTSTDSTRPTIPKEDYSYFALTQTEEATVKNDYISFGGSVVMSSTPVKTIASQPIVTNFIQSTTIIPDKALYTDNKVIDAVKNNGVYPSNGSVSYGLNPYSVNSPYSQKSFLVSVNKVKIHTPVICLPVISNDNAAWTQLIKPTNGAMQIVLDPDTNLNDFTVKISNTLQHSVRLGYYTRDFSKSFIDPDYISYIAKKDGVVRNEMKLPFDVYIDTGGDGNKSNDKFIKSGTWIILGRNAYRFYVPMWVQEGTYTAQFRTIAVNGLDKLDKTETTRNSDIDNYVATATQTFEVSGRIYGLTMYDISDYPNWEEVFRKKDTMLFKLFEGFTDGTKTLNYGKNFAYYYTVGLKDQYGNTTGRYSKYTFPLVNGSHPKFSNRGVLKTGYAVRFMLDTTGELYSNGCQVKITPTFYYVDKNGKNRKQVDLYYKEEIKNKSYNLVKVGAGIDLVNIKSGATGNIYSRISANEIKNTADVMDTTYSKIANQNSTMYSYSVIKLLKAFRTFVGTGYASTIANLSSWITVKDATNQTQTNLSKYMQRWYGTYKMPNDVHAVATGYDVFDYMKKHGIDYKENFWLKDGYIIVNFNIVTVDKNGKERLSYINGSNYLYNGNCSMWVTEGGILQKTDYDNVTFNWKAGDFIMYDTDKKATDDYSGSLY